MLRVRVQAVLKVQHSINNESTHKVLGESRGIESRALGEQLAGFLLPQIRGHDQELRIQSRFPRLPYCRATRSGSKGEQKGRAARRLRKRLSRSLNSSFEVIVAIKPRWNLQPRMHHISHKNT